MPTFLQCFVPALLMLSIICYGTLLAPASALSKEESVYAKLNYDGTANKILVTNHLINDNKSSDIKYLTDLENIVNINGDESYTKSNNNIIWQSNGKDIFFIYFLASMNKF